MNGVCVFSIRRFENWRYWITHTTVMLNTWPQNALRTHTPRRFFLALITFCCLREMPYLPSSKSIQTYRTEASNINTNHWQGVEYQHLNINNIRLSRFKVWSMCAIFSAANAGVFLSGSACLLPFRQIFNVF